MYRSIARLGLPVLALCLTPVAHAADGELWEYAGQITMQGMDMKMPARQVCKRSGTPPQPEMGEGCDVKSKLDASGGTFTFKCPKPNVMEGTGEMRFTADTMRAKIKAKSEGEEMVIEQTGRRIGPCNAPR